MENEGFVINPYDPCVANKLVNGTYMTVVWHVDDAKISHKSTEVLDKFVKFVDDKYGDDELGHVKAVKGNIHTYLGMQLIWDKGMFIVDVRKYVVDVIKEHPYKLDELGLVKTYSPWIQRVQCWRRRMQRYIEPL